MVRRNESKDNMAQYKFWNIGEANTEIDRLTAEVSALNQKLAVLPESTQVASDLATAKQTIATLSTELDSVKADVKAAAEAQSKLEKGHAEELKKIEASVESRAASKAAAIVAGQGLSQPLNQSPPTGLVDKKDFTHLKGLERAQAAHNAARNKQ